jgi:hypothetical protein
MIWIPVEIILEIFRAVQALIERYGFTANGVLSKRRDQTYYNNLLAFALSSKEWTDIAQEELFRICYFEESRHDESLPGRSEGEREAQRILSYCHVA